MKIEVTKAQIKAIIDLRDDVHSMLCSGSDTDDSWSNRVNLIDQMIKKNKINEDGGVDNG